MVQQAHWAQVLLDLDYRPKNVFHSQQKHWCVLYLKCYYVFTKTHGCRATPSHFGPHYPWFCVRAKYKKLSLDQVDLWEGTLQLCYNKLSLKMIDRGSRSTWGPGSSRSRLQSQKHDLPLLKQDWPTTFVL